MKFLRFVPAVLTICLVIGILIGYYWQPKPVIFISLLLANLFILFGVFYFSNRKFGKHFLFNIIAYLLFVNIGISAISIQNIKTKKHFYTNYLSTNNEVQLKIKKRLKPTQFYNKYEAEIIWINQQNSRGKILLNITKDSILKPVIPDAVYYTKTKFKPINQPKNPFQFDYSKYLEKKQIFYQITINKNSLFLLDSSKVSITGFANKIRNKININLQKQPFKKDQLAIINALLLGQRQDISKELITAYQNAGAIHILAVSGLHIGIIYGILWFIFLPVKKIKFKYLSGKTVQFILIIVFLWLYAILAGLSASIVRSATMFTAFAVGEIIQRKSSGINNLFISAFILLLFHPLFLFDIGFQLSYLAVFSILFWQPLFNRLWTPKNKIIRFFWQIFTVSLSAQIGIIPLSLYYFHQFPALFFLSGIVILPVLSVLLGIGFLVIILAYFQVLPTWLSMVYSRLIERLNNFVRFVANQESFLMKQIFFSVLLVLSSYFLIISAYRFLNKYSYKNLVVFMLSILVFQLTLFKEKFFRESEKEIVFFNQNKQSVIGFRKGNFFTVYHHLDTLKNPLIIENYLIGTGVSNFKNSSKIDNVYSINKQKLLVVDSIGIYSVPDLKADIVWLIESPKINLERLILQQKPKKIIVDASNYKSYVKYYKYIAKKYKIPLHYTYEKGFLVIK